MVSFFAISCLNCTRVSTNQVRHISPTPFPIMVKFIPCGFRCKPAPPGVCFHQPKVFLPVFNKRDYPLGHSFRHCSAIQEEKHPVGTNHPVCLYYKSSKNREYQKRQLTSINIYLKMNFLAITIHSIIECPSEGRSVLQ